MLKEVWGLGLNLHKKQSNNVRQSGEEVRDMYVQDKEFK